MCEIFCRRGQTWTTRSGHHFILSGVVSAIVSIIVTHLLKAREVVNLTQWEIKRKACLDALKVVDGFLSHRAHRKAALFTVMFFVLLGAFTFSGIGLLVASRAKTLETVSGLMNLVMLPMWLLSGILFSPDRFPSAAQPLIQTLPRRSSLRFAR